MKLNKNLDYISLGLMTIIALLMVFGIAGHRIDWLVPVFVISLHLLLAIVLFRQTQIPFRYQLPFLTVLSLVIGFSTVYPLTNSLDDTQYVFGVLGTSPIILMFLPCSIIAAPILTLTTWGSLKTLFLARRPQWLPQLSWMVPVFYTSTLFLLDCYLLWPGIRY
jgi:hypothetical protein